MTIRTDISINWEISPRLLVVADPSTEVTIQDLVDTCRFLEEQVEASDDPRLIDAAGKENLGGGVTVGITATLRNTRLAFEARTTETETGTATTLSSNGLTLIDSAATFQSNGVLPGANVVNRTTGASGTVISVDSETQLSLYILGGGSRQDWQVNDTYSVWNEVQCNVSGGNLVAIDSVGADLDPIFPTANTQVVRTASSSATTQNLTTIEQAAFEGGIWYDQINGTAGTAYPQGTPTSPVNNLADAVAIQATSGVGKILYVSGDFDAGAGDALTGWQIHGEATSNHVHLDPGSVFTDCAFYDLHLHGDLFGESLIVRCHIMGVTGLDGMIENCMLGMNDKVLAAGGNAHFVNCSSAIAGVASPTVDCNGTGTPQFRGYNGGIALKNKTSGNASVDLNSGTCTLNTTCTGGTIVVRGTGNLTDNSAGATVISTGLINPETVWGRAVEGTYTAEEIMRLMASILAGKVSGAGSGTEVFRDINDTKNRVTSTVDTSGNRTAITHDAA